MILKDLLNEPTDIEVRTYGPNGEDMLFGYCRWDGEKLISLDGDSYHLDEKISKYEIDKDLVCWIHSEWMVGI